MPINNDDTSYVPSNGSEGLEEGRCQSCAGFPRDRGLPDLGKSEGSQLLSSRTTVGTYPLSGDSVNLGTKRTVVSNEISPMRPKNLFFLHDQTDWCMLYFEEPSLQGCMLNSEIVNYCRSLL
jgi:hypothetical protein